LGADYKTDDDSLTNHFYIPFSRFLSQIQDQRKHSTRKAWFSMASV